MRKALLIRRLKQPRADPSVYFDTGANHLLRTIPKPSLLRAFLLHFPWSTAKRESCEK